MSDQAKPEEKKPEEVKPEEKKPEEPKPEEDKKKEEPKTEEDKKKEEVKQEEAKPEKEKTEEEKKKEAEQKAAEEKRIKEQEEYRQKIKAENDKIIKDWENEVTPMEPFGEKVEVMKIKYTPEYLRIMNLFRGVYNSKIISKKAFDLTTTIISRYADYNAFLLRLECIDTLKDIDLSGELTWLDEQCFNFQKAYSVWSYRKILVDKLNDCTHDKKLMDRIFEKEPKNFHAWEYRTWMTRRFDNTEGEYEFIEKMLEDDVKNNSAWSYRFFLNLYMNGNKLNKDIVEKEIKYALDKIRKYPLNECPFNYIRGLITKGNFKFSDFGFLKEELEKLLKENENNHYDMNLLMDLYEEEKNEERFNAMVEKLIDVDYIRKKYYGWRKKYSVFNEKK